MAEHIHLTINRDFISHEDGIGCVANIARSHALNQDYSNSLEVFYTVYGNGANEVTAVSGSATIPANEYYIEIPINLINAPTTPQPDREITFEITPNPNYEVFNDIGFSTGVPTGIKQLIIKDETPLKAFPTAYGGGAYSKGGRGGNVYHVTHLIDDGSVGSFRWALSQPRPATIIFDVSGVIDVMQGTNMVISGDNLTIAGQSAPLGGITFTKAPLNIDFSIANTKDLIIRYIRLRDQFYSSKGGVNAMPGYDWDGTDNTRTEDVILDHVSISWSGTQGFGIRGRRTNNITFQNSIISECARGSLFGDTDYIGWSYNNTFRNNLLFNLTHRLPNASSQTVDVYNNVIYEWINRLTVIKDGTNINLFNNYYFKGRKSELENYWNVKFVNGVTLVEMGGTVSIYSNGNVIQDLYEVPTPNEELLWMRHAGWDIPTNDQQKTRVDSSYFRTTPHAHVGLIPDDIFTAREAATLVPPNTGAYKYIKDDGTVGIYRDESDAHYLDVVENDKVELLLNPGESTIVPGVHEARDSQRYADFIGSIDGVPINTRPANFYISNPHIPESYIISKGLIGSSTLHNDIAPSGYTWLEEYLNQVDNVETIIRPIITRTDSNPTTIVQGGTYIPPTGIWTDEIDGAGVATVIGTVDTNVLGMQTVKLQHTNTSGNTGYLDIIYTIIAYSGNVVYPLSPDQRSQGNLQIQKLIKSGII